MRTSLILVTIVVISGLVIGCEQQPQQTGNPVVVIDITRIVTEMNWNTLSRAKLRPLQQQITQRLEQQSNLIDNELKDLAASYGEQPTDKQKQEFLQIKNSKLKAFEQEKALAVQEFEQARIKLDKQLKEQLLPFARGAALKHHAKLILTKNQQIIIDNDPSIDITEDVILAMRNNLQANKGLLGDTDNTENNSPAKPAD